MPVDKRCISKLTSSYQLQSHERNSRKRFAFLISLLSFEADGVLPQVEFGAHQAVLVRSMDSFPLLPKTIQDGALVLTVPQAKGLEFDDVFIVNFFKDSPATKDWRILVGLLEELKEANEHKIHDVHVSTQYCAINCTFLHFSSQSLC